MFLIKDKTIASVTRAKKAADNNVVRVSASKAKKLKFKIKFSHFFKTQTFFEKIERTKRVKVRLRSN